MTKKIRVFFVIASLFTVFIGYVYYGKLVRWSMPVTLPLPISNFKIIYSDILNRIYEFEFRFLTKDDVSIPVITLNPKSSRCVLFFHGHETNIWQLTGFFDKSYHSNVIDRLRDTYRIILYPSIESEGHGKALLKLAEQKGFQNPYSYILSFLNADIFHACNSLVIYSFSNGGSQALFVPRSVRAETIIFDQPAVYRISSMEESALLRFKVLQPYNFHGGLYVWDLEQLPVLHHDGKIILIGSQSQCDFFKSKIAKASICLAQGDRHLPGIGFEIKRYL